MPVKVCKSCNVEKPVEAFGKNGKCGRHPRCKICRAEIERQRRLTDGESIRAQERERYSTDKATKVASIKRYYEKNRQAILDRNAKLYEVKADDIKAYARQYRQKNKAKVREWNGTRRAILRQACPSWVDRKAIAAIYREAWELEQKIGIPHHVDHIIPISGRNVCGLHIPENLKAIPAVENLKKGIKCEIA
jgi:hypothetical protein